MSFPSSFLFSLAQPLAEKKINKLEINEFSFLTAS